MLKIDRTEHSLFNTLGVIIISTVLVTISLHSLYSYQVSKQSIVQQMQQNSERSLASLETNLPLFIESYSVNEYLNLLNTEVQQQNYLAIVVEDRNMQAILSQPNYANGKIRLSDQKIVDYDFQNPEHLTIIQEAYYSASEDIRSPTGEVIGKVYVYISDKDLSTALTDVVKKTILQTVTVSLVLILTLFFSIHRFIITPLTRITSNVSQCDEEGVPLHNIEVEGPIEVARLSQSINRMTDTIRDSRIKFREQHILLKQEKSNAEAASIAKSDFLANMSHELRTPMNGVLGMAQLLAKSNLSLEQTEYCEIIMKSGSNLVSLLNDILDLSKIEAGQQLLEEEPFSIQESINLVASLFLGSAKAKNIALTWDIDSTLVDAVVGDSRLLGRILSNLIGNAVKFTHKGEVKLELSLIEAKKDSQRVMFKVTDTGIGISEPDVELIFDTFVQADGSSTRQYGGTGLGLAIVNSLVTLLGGNIQVISELGQGSCFWFELEFQTDHFQATVPSIEPLVEHKRNPLPSGFSVLLVEDDMVNQLVIVKMLEKLHVQAETAINGLDALPKVQQKKYDLILMDILMDGMDGYDATLNIRGSDSSVNQKTPIVAVSALASNTDQDKCFQVGMNDFLVKPLNIDMLEETLQKYTV